MYPQVFKASVRRGCQPLSGGECCIYPNHVGAHCLVFKIFVIQALSWLFYKVVGNTELTEQWRQLGLEVIVTLSETAPAMVRKFGKFLGLLGMCMWNSMPKTVVKSEYWWIYEPDIVYAIFAYYLIQLEMLFTI